MTRKSALAFIAEKEGNDFIGAYQHGHFLEGLEEIRKGKWEGKRMTLFYKEHNCYYRHEWWITDIDVME